MATVRFSVNPGNGEFDVTVAAGAAVVTSNIELTVDLTTSAVNISGGTRALNKAEVLEAIDKIVNTVIKDAAGNFA